MKGRSELHRSPQITTDTTDHTDPKHRSHRSLGNGTDPSKFFKYGSKSIKYGLELPDNHSEVPMASKLVVVPILTPLAIYTRFCTHEPVLSTLPTLPTYFSDQVKFGDVSWRSSKTTAATVVQVAPFERSR